MGTIEVALAHATRLLAKDPRLAAQQAAEILAASPGQARARLIFGAARRMLGETDEALAMLEPLAREQPRVAAVQLELAIALGEGGRGVEAITALHNALRLKPDSADAWRLLADHLDAAGDSSGADAARARHLQAATTDPRLLAAASALVANQLPLADARLSRHLERYPTDVAALRMHAELAARLRRHADAERLLEKCLALAPSFEAARHNYAIVLNRQGKSALALPEIDRLLSTNPRHPGYRSLKAAILASLGDYTESLEIYEAVLNDHPAQPKIWLSYGHALKTANRGADSVTAYRRAIAFRDSLGEAYWSLANLKTHRLTAGDVAAMRAALGSAGLADDDRMHFEFALGKALEDEGRYQESFGHYAAGNALRRKRHPYSAADHTRLVRGLTAQLTPEFFARRAGHGALAADPIFIVGLPRAGSTLLEQMLASHPAVEGTMELPYIPQIARELGAREAAESRADHDALLRAVENLSATEIGALGERYLACARNHRKTAAPFFIDKMPNNFLYVGLIRMILPNAKIIDARRHPLGCGLSLYKQHFARGQNFSYDLGDIGNYYRDYAALMAHFDAVLPGRVHRVHYESVIRHPEREVRSLLAYCGLPFAAACLQFHRNERAVRTASSEQVRRPLFRDGLEHWRHYDPWLGPLKETLGPVLAGYPQPVCFNPAAAPGLRVPRAVPLAAAISAILAVAPPGRAADEGTGLLEEVVVTAQKKTENLQDVPISIDVFDSRKLEQLGITGVDAYVKYSPSVAYVRGQGQGGNGQPGTSHIYIRGVVSGGDGNGSGSQPSVGVYLDEQPVTTIDGTLDMHLYDIQRVEVLEGPQGTLYGASSESGTIRIVTNKPDTSEFSAAYTLEGNTIEHGGNGWQAEGYVNIPLTSYAAIRLVGWDEHDGGYISNVAGSSGVGCIVDGVRTFPSWAGQQAGNGVTVAPCPTVAPIGAGAISNAAYVKNNYNTVDTYGGRATLKVDIGDDWWVLPAVMGQTLNTNGFFGYDPSVGDLELAHFGPENSQDSFVQTALTIDGRFSNFELTYAGAYLKRTTHSIADYADYSEFYDRVYPIGSTWVVGDGTTPMMPQQIVVEKNYYEQWSNELRLQTPQQLPVHGIIGLFIQRQQHDIFQQYVMPGFDFTNPYGILALGGNPNGLDQDLSIPALANSIWLTSEQRVDRNRAIFAQGAWDLSPQVALNAGLRYYGYDNSLQGFFGNSVAYNPSQQLACAGRPPSTPDAPCTNLFQQVSASGTVPMLNVTYRFDNEKLLYATYSKGYRPGGVNRVINAAPYSPDTLINYEIGWKTTWFNHRVRWNGAAFWENWNNFQFSFLVPPSITAIANGGNARITGIENDIEWRATGALLLSANFTFLNPVLTQNYCGTSGVTECASQVTQEFFIPNLVGPLAPAGTNLPVVPKFKGNLVARYNLGALHDWTPFAQAGFVYQTQTRPLLQLDQTAIVGMQPCYGLLDLQIGAHDDRTTLSLVLSNATDQRAQLTRFAQSNPISDNQPYVIPAQPRTLALKFGQKF